MDLLFQVVLRLRKIRSYLLHTAQLNTTAVKNFVRSGEVCLHLFSALLNLSDVLAHLLLVDCIVGLLLLLHAFPSINRPIQLDRSFLILTKTFNLITESIHIQASCLLSLCAVQCCEYLMHTQLF